MAMMPPGPTPPPAGLPAGIGAPPPPGAGPLPSPMGAPSIGGPPPIAAPPGIPQGAGQLDSPFQYLSPSLPPHYQLLDVAVSFFKKALQTGGFRKEPEVEAGIMHLEAQGSQLISNYVRGARGKVMEAPATIEQEPPEDGTTPDAALEDSEP